MKRYINLLPPSEQNQIGLARMNREVLNFGIWVVLSLLVLSLFLFTAKIFLEINARTTAQILAIRQEELEQLEEKLLREEIESLNQDLDNLQKLNAESRNLAPVLTELARLLPADLTLDSLVITRADNKLEATGRAGSRNSVLKLRQSLLSSDYFQNVNFPLSNLERATDVKWKYRFFINPEKLK